MTAGGSSGAGQLINVVAEAVLANLVRLEAQLVFGVNHNLGRPPDDQPIVRDSPDFAVTVKFAGEQ
jgi:hypothetical protein